MDLLSLAGNLASLVGLLITDFTLVEVVRTKSWAKQKLERTSERTSDGDAFGSPIELPRRGI